ncbi:hypothetical protein CES87_01920 [Pseudomonas sp. ERMR1:02]|nr:hypothetical protein CES87_01920 [Pseudomonas sp. ERMR1:02]
MGNSRKEGVQNAQGPITECNAESSFKSKLITCAKAAAVVAGVGAAVLGIVAGIRYINGSGTTSSGAIRENNLTHVPRAEPLISHGDLSASIFNHFDWLGREINVAEVSTITRQSINEFLTELAVADIGGEVVASDGEIQTKFPDIFNALEQGRKGAVVYLKNFRDNCIENCDFPLPPVSEGGSGEYLKGFIGWMLGESTNLTASEVGIATETVYTNLLSEMNVSQDDFESRDSYIGNRTLIDFLIELTENPCHANNLSGQCLKYVLMEQDADGLARDAAANRPPTYAINPSPLPALINSPQVPIVFTTLVENLKKYPLILIHLILHESIHSVGRGDLTYTNVDNNTLSSPDDTLENQMSIYVNTYDEFRKNIGDQLDKVPTPFHSDLENFFDEHIGGPNLTYPEKLESLKKELEVNDGLWIEFLNQVTDLVAMRIATESMRNGVSPFV